MKCYFYVYNFQAHYFLVDKKSEGSSWRQTTSLAPSMPYFSVVPCLEVKDIRFTLSKVVCLLVFRNLFSSYFVTTSWGNLPCRF